TDSSKFGCVHPYPLGPLSRFHRVITDSKISASDQMQLEHAGLLVNVIGSSV
ncbi:TPA: DeoR/GlpR transcriptional regulator, partial [Salmonella enterica subsp. enterica serovar Typhimurium var. monophasic 4,[5],12:i:-]|nr:DeoR/GlpR transcriptional regulator [Salmonella enterica subsp. enterica serovar Typhimurium var. monophasic 4,[5],12:i:-]